MYNPHFSKDVCCGSLDDSQIFQASTTAHVRQQKVTRWDRYKKCDVGVCRKQILYEWKTAPIMLKLHSINLKILASSDAWREHSLSSNSSSAGSKNTLNIFLAGAKQGASARCLPQLSSGDWNVYESKVMTDETIQIQIMIQTQTIRMQTKMSSNKY